MQPKGVTCATAQGPRDYQQDRFLAVITSEPDGLLLAVADGHRRDGEKIAEQAVNFLPKLLAARKGPVSGRISDAVHELCLLTSTMYAGTTLSAVHIVDNTAHVAHIGDSPVIILLKDGKVAVSDEHNVRTNKKERDEAVERGGTCNGYYLYANNGDGLQLARALGNASMGKVIKREPEFYSVPLGPESIVIVCSDGLLDPDHGNTDPLIDQAIAMVKEDGADASALLKWAESRCLRDNATVVVYRHS